MISPGSQSEDESAAISTIPFVEGVWVSATLVPVSRTCVSYLCQRYRYYCDFIHSIRLKNQELQRLRAELEANGATLPPEKPASERFDSNCITPVRSIIGSCPLLTD